MKITIPPLPDKIFGIESSMITVFLPLIAVTIVAVIGFNLIVVPKFADYREMDNNLAQVQDQTKVLLEKIRYIQSIDPNELKKNADFITSALLPQKNSYLLVDVVSKIAVKYGFQIDSFSISPGKLDKGNTSVVKTTTVPRIPILVSIVGPKKGYLDLLKGLERSLPVLTLNSFRMTSQGSLVKLDLDIAAFYLQDASKFDIDKLTLSDLTLKKEETDLLSTLSEFSVTESVSDLNTQVGTKTEFTKYTRTDPFSP